MNIPSSPLRGNYISNLHPSEFSGGWSGMNAALFAELRRACTLHFIGPISPLPDFPARAVSKIWRVCGKQGTFPAFSPRRLNKIKHNVEKQRRPQVDFDFYHGITPWISVVRPHRPYFAYTDACCATYIDHYHDAGRYRADDLHRIFQAETDWMSRASAIFFSSEYARNAAIAAYNLNNHERLIAVGLGTEMQPPDADRYCGGFKFLFVAREFHRKGGAHCVRAFQAVRRKFATSTLTLLGECPPPWVRQVPGVSWGGLLRKSDTTDLHTLRQHYQSAFALLLPTSSDMTPLVIAEAGLFGCPTIATRAFGIPEMIKQGETGLLLEQPVTAESLASAMLDLCEHENQYRAMRQATRTWAMHAFGWQNVARQIVNRITDTVSSPACSEAQSPLQSLEVVQ